MRTDLGDLNQRYEQIERATDYLKYIRRVLRGFEGAREPLPDHFQKALVSASTGDTRALQHLAAPLLSSMPSVLAQMAVRSVQPYTPISVDTTNGEARFVAQGQPKPVIACNLASQALEALKVACIAMFLNEWIKSSDNAVLTFYAITLSEKVSKGEDRALVGNAARVAGSNPAGLLHGLTAAADLGAAIAAVRGGHALRPYAITSAVGAEKLVTLLSAEQQKHSTISLTKGGNILGIPLVIETSGEADDTLILVDAAHLAVADQGMLVAQSEEAALHPDDTAPTSPANLISLFQTNSTALRVERVIDWMLTANDAVAFVTLPAGTP